MADPVPQFNMANILRAQQTLLKPGRGAGLSAPEPEPSAWGAAVRCGEAIRRWWVYSALAALIVIGATLAAEHWRTPVYSAASKVQITGSVVGGGLAERLGGSESPSASALAALVPLRSTGRRISERLVRWAMREGDRAGEGPPAEVMPKLAPGERVASPGWLGSEDLVGSLGEMLSASADAGDVSVELRATVEGRAKLATAIANAAAYALVEEFTDRVVREAGTEKVTAARRRNREELAALATEIRAIGARRLAAGAAGAAGGAESADPAERLRLLGEIDREIGRVAMDAMEAARTLAEFERADRDSEAVDPAPAPLVAKLIDLELRLEGYRKRYTDRHPKMVRVNGEIAAARAAVERCRSAGGAGGDGGDGGDGGEGGEGGEGAVRGTGAVAVEMIKARARVAGLRARAERLKARRDRLAASVSAPAQPAQPDGLEVKLRERKAAEQLAAAIGGELLRSRVLGGEGGAAAPRMEIIPAGSARRQSSSGTMMLIGALVALLAGAGTALALESLEMTARSAADDSEADDAGDEDDE